MDIKYRNANKTDCPKLAEYIYYASDWVIDFLFKDTIPGMTVIQILYYGLENEKRHVSYKSVIVAEKEDVVIGMIQSYSSKYHKIDDEMRSFLPKEKLGLFQEFYESRVKNSLLINTMYVESEFRSKGIGTKLISFAREKAKLIGYDKLSLFVLANNINAQRVYISNGFKTIKEIKIKPTLNINNEELIYLMEHISKSSRITSREDQVCLNGGA